MSEELVKQVLERIHELRPSISKDLNKIQLKLDKIKTKLKQFFDKNNKLIKPDNAEIMHLIFKDGFKPFQIMLQEFRSDKINELLTDIESTS